MALALAEARYNEGETPASPLAETLTAVSESPLAKIPVAPLVHIPVAPLAKIPVAPLVEIPVAPWAEIPVGALVVTPDGRILSSAHNQPQSLSDPTAHAEVLALRRAGEALGNYRLGGCVLVVTLEPCLMCVGAMVHARISGLVFGAADMRTGMVQSCLQGLDLPFHNHRVWHYGGVQAEACAELLRDFFMGARISRHPGQHGKRQQATEAQ